MTCLDSKARLDSPRRILLFVSDVARDLEGYALLAFQLRRLYGYDAELCTASVFPDMLLSYAPHVIVLDQLGTGFRATQARAAKQFGIKVVVLPTAGYFQDESAECNRAGLHHGARELLDLYCAWGEYGQDVLLRHQVLTNDQIRVTGCPRFDFYSNSFRQFLPSKERFLSDLGIQRPSAPLIAITTASYFRRTPFLKKHRDLPISERNDILDEECIYRDLIAIAEHTASHSPHWNILIKVHPTEIPTPYLQFAGRFPNVFVVQSCPLRDVLNACDVLVQRWSTSASEAWMLGKPVIEASFSQYRCNTRAESLYGNHVVTDIEDALSALQHYVSGGALPESQIEARSIFLKNLHYAVDGNSSERCASHIHELLSKPSATQYSAVVQSPQRSFSAYLKQVLGVEDDFTLRFWKSSFWSQLGRAPEPHLDPKALQTLYDRFSNIYAQPDVCV